MTLLRPARDVDLDATRDAFLKARDPHRRERMPDMVKALCSRAADVSAPVLLALGRRLRDGGPLSCADGTRARHVPTQSPWTVAVALERDGLPGHLFAVKLRVPLDASATVRAALEAKQAAHRSRHEAAGLTGDALEEAVMTDSLMDDLGIEDDLERDGYPADLPDPDTVSDVETLDLCRYADPQPPPRPGETFGSYAARQRNSQGGYAKDLVRTVEAVEKGSYLGSRLFESRLSYKVDHDDEPVHWRPGHVNAHDVYDWREPFSKLAAAVSAARLGKALADSAEAVASRAYDTYAEGKAERAVEEIGAALAVVDGGLPGPRAVAFCAAMEAEASSRVTFSRLGDVAAFLDGLAGHGHTDRDERFLYNDLNNSAWVEPILGRDVLTLSDQNGRFVVVVDRDDAGKVEALSVARYGIPLEEFLSRYDRSWERMHLGSDFHRDHANPEDPLSPLPRAGALVALLQGRTDFQGFVGSFRADGRGMATVAHGPYDRRTLADFSMVEDAIHSGRLSIEAEYAPAPRR